MFNIVRGARAGFAILMTNSFRAGLLAAVCTLGLAGAAAPAGAETLAEAVALAYQTNPTLRAQRARLRAVDENVVQAQTGYAPRVSASGNATYTENLNDLGRESRFQNRPNNSSGSGQLAVDQSIYSGGRNAAAVAGARAEVLSGREQLRTVETNVLLSVIQAYADIRRDSEALRIRTENVRVLRQQVEESRVRFEVGEITRTDVAQSEARLALSEASLASTQATLANSRARYASVVGQNPGELAPEPPLPALPTTVDQAYVVAESENPQIRAADFATQTARTRVRAARAEFSPSVNLTGRYNTSNPLERFEFENFNQSASVGLGATIPLFTGGLNASRVRQALENENTARFQVDEARRTVLNDVAQAWNGVLAARAGLISNQEQVRAASVAFEGVQAEFQVGLRTTLDVLNAQQELRNAELLLINSRRDAYVAEASVLASMGRLQAQNLIEDVPIYDPTYTVQRRGLRDGALPYEGVLERLDNRAGLNLERPNRTTTPVVEAPLDITTEWRPQSAPVVVPTPPPPPVTSMPATVPSVAPR
jgi:outer membrane protein